LGDGVIMVPTTALVDVVLEVSFTAIVVISVMFGRIKDVVELALTFTVNDEIFEITNLVVFGISMTVVL